MIIFGWGHQTIKHFGPTFKNHCSHCNNEEYWTLTRYTTWFTLFFIPVIPYSATYFLSCPICQHGITLDNEQIEQIKPIAEVNQLLIDKKITEAEYKTRVEQLGNETPSSVKSGASEQAPSKNISESNKFCPVCGLATTKDIKFCGNCGAKISN
jgi:hypothetical protein